jgi:hypothetical protein
MEKSSATFRPSENAALREGYYLKKTDQLAPRR